MRIWSFLNPVYCREQKQRRRHREQCRVDAIRGCRVVSSGPTRWRCRVAPIRLAQLLIAQFCLPFTFCHKLLTASVLCERQEVLYRGTQLRVHRTQTFYLYNIHLAFERIFVPEKKNKGISRDRYGTLFIYWKESYIVKKLQQKWKMTIKNRWGEGGIFLFNFLSDFDFSHHYH